MNSLHDRTEATSSCRDVELLLGNSTARKPSYLSSNQTHLAPDSTTSYRARIFGELLHSKFAAELSHSLRPLSAPRYRQLIGQRACRAALVVNSTAPHSRASSF